MSGKKTAIVTGASGGIGAGLVEEFLKRGYNVVATSLNASRSFTAAPSLVVVDGDIGKQEAAAKASKEHLEKSRRFSKPVVTQIVPAVTFFEAEDYHQQYLEKRGLATCHIKV